MRVDVCVHCGGREHWRVEPMLEHAYSATIEKLPLGGIDLVAPLGTLICKGCGYTVWYSGAVAGLTEDRGRISRIVNPELSCRDCAGQSHYLVAQVQEWPARDDHFSGALPMAVLHSGTPSRTGKLALLVCGGCGRSDWYAWAVPRADGDSEVAPQACRRCRAPAQRVIEKLREHGSTTLPVAWRGDRALGHFELRFCDDCGLCDWFARDLHRLRDDGAQVRLVKAAARAARPAEGGPYR
jgi:hypothetical protein